MKTKVKVILTIELPLTLLEKEGKTIAQVTQEFEALKETLIEEHPEGITSYLSIKIV